MIKTGIMALVFLAIPQSIDYPNIKLGEKNEFICQGKLICTDLRKFSEFKIMQNTHNNNSDLLNRLIPEFKFYIGEVWHLLDPLENIELLHKDCVILVERISNNDLFIFYNENKSEWRSIAGCLCIEEEKQNQLLKKIAQILEEGKKEQRKIFEDRIMPVPTELFDDTP